MQGRIAFIEELIDTLTQMIHEIEEREQIEPDLALTREIAEQLREEIETLE